MYQSMPVTRDLTSALRRSSSFPNFCFSYRRLFIALRSSLLRVAVSSLWFVYGKLKFMNLIKIEIYLIKIYKIYFWYYNNI